MARVNRKLAVAKEGSFFAGDVGIFKERSSLWRGCLAQDFGDDILKLIDQRAIVRSVWI
jgi:hypothetical protein